MKKNEKVLVIRSCSLDIFNNSWETIYKKFDNAEYYLLTPSEQDIKDKRFHKVFVLPSSNKLFKRYSIFHSPIFPFTLKKYNFSSVIILYSNSDGVDYSNIRMLARLIKGTKKYALNNFKEWGYLDDDQCFWLDLFEELEYEYTAVFHKCMKLFLSTCRKIQLLREGIFKASPKKITFITTTLVSGGVEVLLLNLIKYFLSKGYQVQLISTSGGRLISDFEELPIQLDVYERSTSDDIFSYKHVTWCVKCLNQFKPDILFNYHYRSFLPGLIAGILTKVPILLRSENVLIDQKLKNSIIFKRMIIFEDLFDRIFTVSSAVKKDIFWVNKEKIEVILGTSVSEEKFYDVQPLTIESLSDKIKFLTISRLTENKGIRYLLEAICEVTKIHKQVEFFIVGEGEKRNDLIDLAKQLSIEDYIHFLGYRDDIPELFSESHVFILPSLYEGLPLVIIEAMQAGRCIIATSVAGTPELIKHKENGILVKPADSKDLSNGILSLLNNSELIVKFANKALKDAKGNYNLENMSTKIEKLMLVEWEKRRKER